MKRIELFTKEEIEKYGFIYEPDASKCKTGKTKITYRDSSRNENTGIVTHHPSIFEYSGLSREYIMEEIAFGIFYKYINSIFVNIEEDFPFSHVHNKVMFSGHTPKPHPTDEEVEKFLEKITGNIKKVPYIDTVNGDYNYRFAKMK